MAGSKGYWQRALSARLSRRRALAATAAAVAATAALAACGSPETGAGPSPTPGLLSYPEDTSSRARSGGALKSFALADVPSFDPHSAQSTTVHTQVAAYTYPRLLKFATAKDPERAKGDVEGDLAESFEFSGDRLQLILKLRQGLKWDSRPPVNGRAIDAQDVVASWNRFLRLSPYRIDMAYDAALAPGAPVESVGSPDARTVVFKLRQPDAAVTALFASDRLFYVLPKEADAGFDPRYEQRGYGPYRLGENRAGAYRSWLRNPDYHVKNRPFIDTIELPIFGNYASRLAQFKAGNIWTHVASMGDIIDIKHEMPALLLRKAEHYATAPSSLAFGYAEGSPWKDERLRQAASMLIDRETMIDVQTRRGRYWAEGLPFDLRFHTAVGAGWDGYWLDPQSDTFGPNGDFLRFNPEEARKLMAAAGFEDGLDSVLHFSGGLQYGGTYARTAELVSGMLASGGIRVRLEPHDYSKDWLPNYQYAYSTPRNAGKPIKGFSGLIFRQTSALPHPAYQLFAQMHRDGVQFEGMTPDGRSPEAGDPAVNNAAAAIRREFDIKKQQQLTQEFAKMIAKTAYVIPNVPYSALGYTLTWPALANLGAYHGWPSGAALAEASLNLWIDTSKPPLGPG